MRRFAVPFCAALIGLVAFSNAGAQFSRYETGRHLRSFEIAWEQYGRNDEAQKRIVVPLFDAFRGFVSGQWPSACESLDRARYLLASTQMPSTAVQWCDSLSIRPDLRIISTAERELRVRIDRFYKAKQDYVGRARIQLRLTRPSGEAIAETVVIPAKLPHTVSIRLPKIDEGDYRLAASVAVGETHMPHLMPQAISIISDLESRLERLRKYALAAANDTIEEQTLRLLVAELLALRRGTTLEIDYPAARILRECETIVAAVKEKRPYFAASRNGDYRIRLMLPSGARVVRLFVPPEIKPGEKRPLVIALHGMGGSENLFFEGYGLGRIVRLCRKRGWILAAPRTRWLSFQFPVDELTAALAKRYPVDDKGVFVIGHSMGAAQVCHAIQQPKNRIRAAAALGGSGSVSAPDRLKELDLFIGVGKRDFAYEGAKRLAERLRAAGLKRVRLVVYPHIEHITIVRAALDDVFATFDATCKKASNK